MNYEQRHRNSINKEILSKTKFNLWYYVSESSYLILFLTFWLLLILGVLVITFIVIFALYKLITLNIFMGIFFIILIVSTTIVFIDLHMKENEE